MSESLLRLLDDLRARLAMLERLETPVVSGGGAGAPANATYLTLEAEAVLSAERRLVPAARLVGTDAGPNSTYTLDLATSGVAAGAYGSATQSGTFTVDAYGRLTAAANVAISGVAPSAHNLLSAFHGDTVANAATRGSLLYGNATPAWDELVLGGISGSVLTRDQTDARWSAFGLAGTAGQTYTFPAASGSVPTGTGTAGRIVEWAAGGATLQDSTLVKTGAGVLTLSAGGAYTLTVPETMTVAGRNVANTFTQAQVIEGSADTEQLIIKANSTQNDDIVQIQNSSGTVLSSFSNLGYLGVGAAAISDKIINAQKTNLNIAAGAGFVGIETQLIDTSTSAGVRYIRGFTASINSTSAYNNTGYQRASSFSNFNNGSAKITTLQSVFGQAGSISGTGSAGTVSAFTASLLKAAGSTFDVAYGLTANYNVASLHRTAGIYLEASSVATPYKYGLYIGGVTNGSIHNYSIYTSTGLVRLGDQLSVVGSADRQQALVTGYTTQATGTPLVGFTRNDAAAGVAKMLALTGLGSGADLDGVSIDLYAKSSTDPAIQQARIYSQWAAGGGATHATRKAQLVGTAWDTAEREGWRIGASGSAPMLSFYGGTPVVRGAALTTQLTTITHTAPGTPDYAIQNLIDSSAGAAFGFATQDEGNTVLSVIANLQTRVAELENRLSATGVNLIA